MRSKLAGHLTYGNVVATLALFLALGGTSVAAIQLSKNSVKARHIAKNAVGSSEVKDRALRVRDFAAGQLPAGQAGPQGPPGVPGATNLIAREREISAQYSCVPPVDVGLPPLCTPTQPDSTVTVSCEPGERAVYTQNGTPVPVGGSPTGFKVPPPLAPLSGPGGPVTVTGTVTIVCAAP